MKKTVLSFSIIGFAVAIFSGSLLLIFKSNIPLDGEYAIFSEVASSNNHNIETLGVMLNEHKNVIIYQDKVLNLSLLTSLSLILFIFSQSSLIAIYIIQSGDRKDIG